MEEGLIHNALALMRVISSPQTVKLFLKGTRSATRLPHLTCHAFNLEKAR